MIDYDVAVGEGEEQYKVYFLNQVDESDLAALVGDSSADLDDYDYGEVEKDEVMESDNEDQPED